MRKAHLQISVLLLIVVSACTSPPPMDVCFLGGENVKNVNALQLIRLMQEQEGSYERFERELSDKVALYEYTVLEASGDYGMYYSVPYTNSNNVVEGCIVYPVDELLSWEAKRTGGILGTPFRIDAVVLNEQIPITKQYLYSSLFKDWRIEGLVIADELVAPAILLEESPIITNGKVQTRYGIVSGYGYGDCMGVVMDYTYTDLSRWTHDGLIVSTVNLEELKNEIETFLVSGAEMPGGIPIYSECIHMSAFRMEALFAFDKIVNVEYARKVMSNLAGFLNTYWKYRQYSFRCQYTCRFAGIDGYIPPGSGTIFTGGGSGNNSGISSPPSYPLVEKIIYDEGNLTSKQLEQLNEAIQEAINHNCYIEAVFNYLTKKECQFSSVNIDPSLQGSGGNSVLLDGEGNPVRVILKFSDEEYICARTFSHELIHLLQIEQGMYEGLDSRGMMEYERVLIDDIVFYSRFKGKIERATYEDWNSKLYFMIYGQFSGKKDERYEEWNEQQEAYKIWLENVTKKGVPEYIADSDFQRWASLFFSYDRVYSIANGYKHNESYAPIALNKMLGLIKENCK